MSATNYFIVKKKNHKIAFGLEECTDDLVRLALEKGIGIRFNILDYKSEVLKSLGVNWDYFWLSDGFYSTETDELFSQADTYEQIKRLKPKEGEAKERELLSKKYDFFNRILHLLFKQSNVESVDFYVAYSPAILSDYKTVEIKDRNLTQAFINMLSPTKQENYFGLKTTKFVIK